MGRALIKSELSACGLLTADEKMAYLAELAEADKARKAKQIERLRRELAELEGAK